MLTQIHIRNFAIIDELSLDFQAGMTVLTGETGAGKSIVIDALSLVLGERADSQLVRQGQERCEITAIFDISQLARAQQWLVTHDFDEADECILRRVISRDGKSRSSINGQPVTLQMLKALGELLIAIHGQHAHQLLQKHEEQRRLLDIYAKHPQLLQAVAESYQAWQAVKAELAALQQLTGQADNRLDWLRYQVEELTALDLAADELALLEQEHRQLHHHGQLVAQSQLALQFIATDEGPGVLSLLHRAQTALSQVLAVDSQLQASHDLLSSALTQAAEGAAELRHYLDGLELDEQRLQWVEQRLQAIYDLARKHKVPAKELPTVLAQLSAELNRFGDSEAKLQALQQQEQRCAQAYYQQAAALTASRQQAAIQLEQAVIHLMQQLNFKQAQFAINFVAIKAAASPWGQESVEFLVSTNPGQALQSMQKVASGGELSRLSLAIQVATAELEATPSLIFDEVDVGIGGTTAAVVGQLLRRLGQYSQVLCVTHLPQVAACGHQHWQVSKHSEQQQTTTLVKALDEPLRIQELARMLGGLTITAQTLAHAKEMLTQASS